MPACVHIDQTERQCAVVRALVVRNLISKDTVAQPAAVSSLHLPLQHITVDMWPPNDAELGVIFYIQMEDYMFSCGFQLF